MSSRSTGLVLGAIAFLSGAALMGLEIVGSRVLAPYFGSSVFVWGSLIGVVLAAISAGAFLAGRLADRVPDRRPLFGLLAIAGLASLSLPFMAPVVNHQVFLMDLGPRAGPLLASVGLFLIPGITLGGVTPFIVRLSATSVGTVGRVAGTVSALSTAGSILGTLGTAFYLIPEMGVRSILFALGLLLLILAAASLFVKSASTGDRSGGSR